MPTEWIEASPDVIETAQELIASHHPHLADVRIVFMCRSEPALASGKTVYGNTQKVNAQMRLLLDDADFIIWVSRHEWENKTRAWRKALMDHCLCHCQVIDDGEKTTYAIRPHDIEEFHAVISRHGAYTLDIQQADAAIETAKTNQLMFTFNQLMEAMDKPKTPQRGGTFTIDANIFNRSRVEG